MLELNEIAPYLLLTNFLKKLAFRLSSLSHTHTLSHCLILSLEGIKHRSNDRTFTNLKGVFFSGIVRQLQKEVTLMAIVATFVVLWNEVLVSELSTSLSSLPHLALPLLPFQLSSPALGLLLVFRTNASYQRWLEARLRFGIIISQSKNILRMASTFVDDVTESYDHNDDIDRDSNRKALQELARSTWVLSRSIVSLYIFCLPISCLSKCLLF